MMQFHLSGGTHCILCFCRFLLGSGGRALWNCYACFLLLGMEEFGICLLMLQSGCDDYRWFVD